MSSTTIRKHCGISFIFLLSILLSSAPVSSKNIHMAPGGNDSSGNGTIGNPYEGLQMCLSIAVPGDTVFIHEGEYWNEPRNGGYRIYGEPGNWIVITSYPGESKPIFRGVEPLTIADGVTSADNKVDSKYFVLKDIVFDRVNPNYHCLHIMDGGTWEGRSETPIHDFIVDGCEFYTAGVNAEGIKLAGTDHFVIRNCTFNFSNTKNIALAGMGCHYGEIYNNTIDSCNQGGIQFKGGSCNIVVRNNRINYCYYSGINFGGDAWYEYARPSLEEMDLPRYECKDSEAYSNYIYNCYYAVELNSVRGCKVYNNFFWRDDNAPGDMEYPVGMTGGQIGVRHSSASLANDVPSHRCEIYNNIFYFAEREEGYGNVIWWGSVGDEGDSSSTFKFYNNLFYCFEDPSKSFGTWDWGGRVDMPDTSANIFGADPMLWLDPTYNVHRPTATEANPVWAAGIYPDPPAGFPYNDYLGIPYKFTPSIGPIEINTEDSAPPIIPRNMNIGPF